MRKHQRLSVVVISRDEGAELACTVENLEDTLPDGGEIIVVDDGSRDGSAEFLARRRGRVRLKRKSKLGVARARNYGASLARGDVVVFADAHIRLPRDWWKPLLDLVADPKIGGAAPAITHLPKKKAANGYGLRFDGPELDVAWLPRESNQPFATPILPGCCFAMRKDVVEKTGGWDEGMLVRGGVDNEGCVRFWLMGFDLMIAPEVLVQHKFRAKSPYPVLWPQYIHNKMRLAYAHLKPSRLGRVVGALRDQQGYGEALELIATSDIAARRGDLLQRRARSDDWYFERFGMKW